MDKIIITGGKKLYGEVEVSGAKNAAVAMIPAAILINGICRIENIPNISDVDNFVEILYHMGATIKTLSKSALEIDCSSINATAVPKSIVKKMRASYYLIGALLGRFKQAAVDMPGGCDFGQRPIDQHIKGFEALGAEIKIENGTVFAKAGQLTGGNIYLDVASVGATMNIMLAAVLAKGQTIIENPAKEPHVVDLANFLNSMGAIVKGAGTDIIKITGVEKLYGGVYTIIPDQIEAGTFMVAAAAAGGNVLVKNVIPKHLEAISAKLTEIGAEIVEGDDEIRVKRESRLSKANIKALPYPGFPTDMQPQITALLSTAEGTSIITDGVYDNRFKYLDELKRMGASAQCDGNVAVVEGGALTGAAVRACDLRAGAAMIIAGLCAHGKTVIEDIEHIERGYENITDKLSRLGADIQKVTAIDSYTVKKQPKKAVEAALDDKKEFDMGGLSSL